MAFSVECHKCILQTTNFPTKKLKSKKKFKAANDKPQNTWVRTWNWQTERLKRFLTHKIHKPHSEMELFLSRWLTDKRISTEDSVENNRILIPNECKFDSFRRFLDHRRIILYSINTSKSKYRKKREVKMNANWMSQLMKKSLKLLRELNIQVFVSENVYFLHFFRSFRQQNFQK